MDPLIRKAIDKITQTWELQQMMMQEDAEFVSDDDKVLPLGEETARFVYELALQHGCKNFLEIGTSHGYSTLFLADIAKKNNGHVTTIEKRESKIGFAQTHFEESHTSDHITILKGDARSILPTLEGPFDFVLLDARKDQYIDYFKLIFSRLASGAIICADNMDSPAFALTYAKEYQKFVRTHPGCKTTTHHIGQGIEVTIKN